MYFIPEHDNNGFFDYNPYLSNSVTVTAEHYTFTIGFMRGEFNYWCVYCRSKGVVEVPRDVIYFNLLKKLQIVYGSQVFYDFMLVYFMTKPILQKSVIYLINQLASNYDGIYQVAFLYTMYVIYYGMVAEDHYYVDPKHSSKRSRLGKRVKLVGVWQLLRQGFTPEQASQWSRGKSASVIWNQINMIRKALNDGKPKLS